MNKPISYPLAKLLKEKGFNEPTIHQYYTWLGVHEVQENSGGKVSNSELKEDIENNNFDIWISAPTIADVVMWLYEKHKIWVSVSVDTLFNKGKFCILIYKDKGLGLENYPLDNTEFSPYESPTEAYEAAIEYALTKLI